MLLIISDFTYPQHSGGVAKHIYYLDKFLQNTDVDYRIYGRGTEKTNYKTNEQANYGENALFLSGGKWKFIISLIFDSVRAKKIVCHYVILGLLLVILKKIIRVQYTFFFHGPIDEEYEQKTGKKLGAYVRRKLQTIVIDNAEKILVHSKYMHEILLTKTAKSLNNVEYVPPFTFPDYDAELQYDEDTLFDEPYILISRRLTARSGVSEFLQFIIKNNLFDRVPRIVITGEGEERNAIEELSNASPHVNYLGHVSEIKLRTLVYNATAVVVPSKSLEGLGYIILEAMQSGTPAIVSDCCGGGKDFVHERFPDLVFRLGDENSFLESLAASRKINRCSISSSVEYLTFENMVKIAYV